MTARFGPAGNSESFSEMGYKNTLQVPEYLVNMGLTAFEYQCGRGVRIKKDVAETLSKTAKEAGIALSLHAPYYISLSSVEEEKRENSVRYILQSAEAVNWMGGDRIIIHAGSCGKMSRAAALSLAKDTMQKAITALDEQGLSHIHLCPETMGKINQLGTLDEVLALCALDERMIPCIDFGHLYARSIGQFESQEDFGQVFAAIENTLGSDRLKSFHSHFSKIAYTPAGGEKHHLKFSDEGYGPDYRHLIEWILRKNSAPTVICESAGTQAEDAKIMMEYYHNKKAVAADA